MSLTIANQVEARLNIILPLLYNCDKQNEKKGLFKKKIKNRHRRDVCIVMSACTDKFCILHECLSSFFGKAQCCIWQWEESVPN